MEAMVPSHDVRHRKADPVKTLSQMASGPPGPRPAQRAGRPTIYGAEGGVEAADAGEARGEGDRGQGHDRLLDEALRPLHPACVRHGQWRGARVSAKEPSHVPGRHAEGEGKIVHGSAVVEEAALDEAERARDGSAG